MRHADGLGGHSVELVRGRDRGDVTHGPGDHADEEEGHEEAGPHADREEGVAVPGVTETERERELLI